MDSFTFPYSEHSPILTTILLKKRTFVRAKLRSGAGRKLAGKGSRHGEIGSSWKAGDATATVGYDVVPGHQRQGFATEALKTLSAWLMAQPGVECVIADTFPDHIASRRVMEKAGMKLARTIRRVEDGEERDLVVYEMRRGEG